MIVIIIIVLCLVYLLFQSDHYLPFRKSRHRYPFYKQFGPGFDSEFVRNRWQSPGMSSGSGFRSGTSKGPGEHGRF